MLLTVAKLSELYNEHQVPSDVSKALKLFDPSLMLVFYEEGWQVYKRNKYDEYIHQLTLPFNLLTPGAVINYLKRFDTNPMGMKSQDEIKDKWLNNFKRYLRDRKEKREKDKREFADRGRQFVDFMKQNRKQISVPICVGIRNGRRVYAVKKEGGNDNIITT